MSDKKLISIITPCYNERLNVKELHEQVDKVMSEILDCDYEHIFIDNASTDGTDLVLREMAKSDKRVKLIFNTRNFGHIRSPYYALLQSKGDASVVVAADFQDPPEILGDFVERWRSGFKVVIGVKAKSDLNPMRRILSTIYYKLLNRLTDVPLVEHYMGYGLFDREVIETMRAMDDPYPYMRGMIADIGFESAKVEYIQPKRRSGKAKNNLYTLFDMAMLGLTNNTKVPLRLATFCGFAISAMSFIVGLVYLIYKLVNWQEFDVGVAPLIIGISFLGGVQLVFLGLIGEYIGAIYTQVLHRPLVIEKERVNFD